MAVKVKNISFLEEVLTIHALLSQYTRLTDWEWEYTSEIITSVLDSQILRDHNFWSASLREETSSFIPLSSAFSDFNSEIGFLCYSFMLCSSLGTLVSHQNSVVLMYFLGQRSLVQLPHYEFSASIWSYNLRWSLQL